MDVSIFNEPGNKLFYSNIIEVVSVECHLCCQPCCHCLLNLIIVHKSLSTQMFLQLRKQVKVLVWNLDCVMDVPKLPTQRIATIPVSHEQYADRCCHGVDRLPMSTFVLNSPTQHFHHLAVSSSIDNIAFEAKFNEKWPLSASENSCHDILNQCWSFEFFIYGECVAPLHWWSLILRCVVIYPSFIIRQNTIEKIVSLFFIMCEKCLCYSHSILFVILSQHIRLQMSMQFPIP